MRKICDVHSHVIPFIDDGARDFDMAIHMLNAAYRQGVNKIVCSSHSGFNNITYLKNIETLRCKLKENNIDINLYTGCEVYCDEHSIYKVLAKLHNKELFTINGTNYVLVEFDPYEDKDVIYMCCKMFTLHGYKPVIAHIERYFDLHNANHVVEALKTIGCLFQVNAYNLYNVSDSRIKSFAQKLLKNRLVSFIGSDAHRTDHRNYMINDGINYIYKICDSEYADSICYKNAENLFELK